MAEQFPVGLNALAFLLAFRAAFKMGRGAVPNLRRKIARNELFDFGRCQALVHNSLIQNASRYIVSLRFRAASSLLEKHV